MTTAITRECQLALDKERAFAQAMCEYKQANPSATMKDKCEFTKQWLLNYKPQ